VCRLLAVSTCLALAAGARAQCANVADLSPGAAPLGQIDKLTDFFGGSMFFRGSFPSTGSELWQWDPVNGAHLVADLAPGPLNSNPEQFQVGTTALGPRLFFSAFEIGHGSELYTSDGTAAGTGRLKEIAPGSASSLVSKFCAVNDRMFFQANDGVHGDELWVSDGTPAGTYMVLDIFPGSLHGRPDQMCALDDKLLFSAMDANWDRELWVSDGTAAGTYRLLDIFPGTTSGDPYLLTRAGDQVFFQATTPGLGAELWKTDGTAAGTMLVKDLNPGSWSGSPIEFCACGDRVFFLGRPDPTQQGIFVSDGTAAGTTYLGVRATGTLLSGAIRCVGNRVFFAGDGGPVAGTELFVSDGTVAGTQMVADLVPTGSTYPHSITPAGNGVFFTSSQTAAGRLWYSDGTAAGTVPLCLSELTPGYEPNGLTMSHGHLFFRGSSPTHGLEIFRIATPGASTTVLGPGGRPSFTRLRVRDNAVPVLGTSIDLVGSGPSGQFSLLLGSEILPPLPAPVVPGLIDGGTDWTGILLGLAIQLAVYATPDTSWTFVIANDPAMEGMLFRFQMLWLDPAATTPFHLSNGLQLALGTAGPH
jgi:ELWxxDGT repeat protein